MKPVGVQAADPSQNGRPNTSGALSPLNENSVGVGFQIELPSHHDKKPKKAGKTPQNEANGEPAND